MNVLASVDELDIGAVAGAAIALLFAYVVYPHTIVQYGAWLVVFTIWMAWFVYHGTKRIYGVEK
jgi:hypothetical protein